MGSKQALPAWRVVSWILALIFLAAAGRAAASLACSPCAGIRTSDPTSLLAQLLEEPRLEDEALLYVAWTVELEDHVTASPAQQIVDAGGTPLLGLKFRTSAPLVDHLDSLERELEVAARLAREAGPGSQFQVLWDPAGSPREHFDPEQYSFLVKRATVTVTGAQPDSSVYSEPLTPDQRLLRQLFEQDVAAYLDGLVLQPSDTGELEPLTKLLTELDPGVPVVVDAMPFPDPAEITLSQAARNTVAGVSATLFEAPDGELPSLRPLKQLALDFSGDLSYDPYSTPFGNVEAWSFVRGEDLALRVIVEHDADATEAAITFSDTSLRQPSRVDLTTGERLDMYGGLRSTEELELRWEPSQRVSVLSLERLTLAEREGSLGLTDELTVVSERNLPVEEILRRLQAVEDAQSRRLENYLGINTTHLRFEFSTQGVEVTFEGRLFYQRGAGYDWAWERFFVNGLKWKGRKMPQIPLIQPERAANLPLEIAFTRDYNYQLRGTEIVDDRDCWVVDFRPRITDPDKSLFRGTVWIDRELFVRVRSRGVQLGLEGDVVSNEETIHYSPIDSAGQPADWRAGSFWLPLRMVSQQIWSIFNTTTVVEKETLLTQVELNSPGLEAERKAALESDATMVRDTAEGLRYLVIDKKTGEREVQENLAASRLFLVGGLIHDDALDYPLPLLGIDYFSLDFKGTGAQVNAFFAGALINASIADTNVLGSRFGASSDLFLVAVPFTDTLYAQGEEVEAADVRERPASIDAELSHLIGAFTKINLQYELRHSDYSRADDTSDEFVIPESHFTHELGLRITYTRSGYRFRATGSYAFRSQWEPWGFPDSGDYDPATKEYQKWGASIAKTFHLPKFRKFGMQLEYVDGQDLDRFSKYQFGSFSDIRVHGYQTGKIRAESASALNLSYGIEMGELFRLEGLGDVALANDRSEGLDQELLGGLGVAGTIVGPWKTLVRLDLGVPVVGPDDGFTLFLTFLKLFK
jgi:hypothetical protein